MSCTIASFLSNAGRFIQENKVLCVLTLGLAVVGFSAAHLSGRTFAWIRQCFGPALKTDSVGRQVLEQPLLPTEGNRPLLQPSPFLPAPLTESKEIVHSSLASEKQFLSALEKTSEFAGYGINLPAGHPCEGVVLTGLSLRPSNLFFAELFKGSQIAATLPGSYQLFAFNTPHERIREYCEKKLKEQPDGFVSFSANGIAGHAVKNGKVIPIADLGGIFGQHTYRISFQEIIDILDSQKIFTSSLLPLPFYRGLKKAMQADQIVVLPGQNGNPLLLKELKGNTQIGLFIEEVEKNPQAFGFESKAAFELFLNQTLYQIGAMVVKSEDFRIFIDGAGKMLERTPGKQDAIRLINACGIRCVHSGKTPQHLNKPIMTETFKTAIKASEKGIAVFPAVGMGIWRGDPDLYWRAFLDAVMTADELEMICVNPGHQPSLSGPYKGCKGEEFQQLLDEYLARYQGDERMTKNLRKILNLYESKKDVVQLAYQLKLAYPDKVISLFNASDPDVTLGYHVGEYTNNLPHANTTEENYTAMGTNGLCFEGITRVHDFEERLIQA